MAYEMHKKIDNDIPLKMILWTETEEFFHEKESGFLAGISGW